MKKKVFILLLAIIVLQLAKAQTATQVQVLDTRSDNSGPNVYGHEAKFEFKYCPAVGVPGSYGYSGMFTFAPWSDNSGSMHHQLNFNDGGIYYRNGLPQNTTWNTWQKLIIGDANGNVSSLNFTGSVGIGNISPKSVLHVSGSQNLMWSNLNTNNAAGTGLVTIGSIGGNGSLFINTPTVNTNYPSGLGIDGSYNSTTRISTINIKACGTNDPYYYSNLTFSTSSATTLIEAMRIDAGGNVGIGTTIPAYKLDVLGTIRAQEVKVDLAGKVADFVFAPSYQLRPLSEVEKYVKANSHLPEIPSAAEVAQNGLSLGEMQNKLLQKVEELTLYTIEQDKKIQEQDKKNAELQKQIDELKTLIKQK